jgi:hypothetical protein
VNVILYLLYQTILYADTNKMGATNMAVVFGQIFLCEPISVNESDQSNLNAAIKEVEMRNKACELMITNYYKLFTGKEGSLQRVYYPYLQEQNVGIIEDNSDPIETLNGKILCNCLTCSLIRGTTRTSRSSNSTSRTNTSSIIKFTFSLQLELLLGTV